MSKYPNSSKLFSNPSLIEGISRILDIGNTINIYNDSRTELEADLKALHRDWYIVGNDLRCSIEKYEQETQKNIR